ncbi:uncharacterized protein CCDC198-like [Acipenser ruthenus]|uniref:uncharacterized protein CCDC198-like n=1 Tax=Acipenser ruthenus TaxID=7906 RepID=UPI00274071D9|nr:uncharacterized protein CCDC198-like [Acipenser ruthenus]
MGSTNSRPKLTRVAPLQSPHNGGVSLRDGRGIWARPYRSPEPLQSGAEQQEVLGRRRTGRLPPLRQEAPLSFAVATAEPLALPPLYTGPLSLDFCSGSAAGSIIQTHPPRRPQRLEPLAPPTKEFRHQRLESAANRESEDREWGKAVAQRSSTHSQRGRSRAGGLQQGQESALLAAQAEFSQQSNKLRRDQRLRARELRKQRDRDTARDRDRDRSWLHKDSLLHQEEGDSLDTDCGGGEPDGRQGQPRVRLVKRSAERDIFWDTSSGEGLDLGEQGLANPRLCVGEQAVIPGDPWTRVQQSGTGGEWKSSPRPSEHGAGEAGKPKPWMMDWEADRDNHLSFSRLPENRGERGACWGPGQSDCRMGEECKSRPKLREGGQAWKHRPRLSRTKAEAIPAFEESLDYEM